MDFTGLQAVTLAIATIGAVLGVLNTWRAFSSDRLVVKVRPLLARNGAAVHLCVEVVNLSAFAVTITHMGFDMRGTDRHLQFVPLRIGGGELPVRLESRTAFTGYMAAGAHQSPGFERVINAYVQTACGHKITGRSKMLEVVVDQARGAQAQGDFDA